MRPLHELEPGLLSTCLAVLTDIDDTLTDDALMRAHRLELPWGFDPRSLPVDSLPR